MKRWFRITLVIVCLVEVMVGSFVVLEVYKKKQARVLGVGAVSFKDKSLHPSNVQSTLKYFSEPASSQNEQDTSPWLQQKVVWTYNSDSLNDRFDYLSEKPPKTFRILTLGDSFTFGDHVNTADNWSERLEDMLNTQKICSGVEKYEVINLGVCGYDVQHAVERYRLRGQKYDPDLVLWMLIQNDFEEINEISLPMQRAYYQQLQKDNMLDPKYPYSKSDELGREAFMSACDETCRLAMIDEYVKSFYTLYQGPLVLITYPFIPDIYRTYLYERAKERKEANYFDELPDIYQDDSLTFMKYGDGHPSIKGHAIIAERIYEYLQQHSLISCN